MDLIEQILRTPNRGRMHLFLGEPGDDPGNKTVVEPGCGFSPGLWTCGVYVAIRLGSDLVWPDRLAPDELSFGFDGPGGLPPLLHSRWTVGPRLRVEQRLGQLRAAGGITADICQSTILADDVLDAELVVFVRPNGPAGGSIESIDWTAAARTLLVHCSGQAGCEPIRVVFEAHDRTARVEQSPEGPVAVVSQPLSLTPGVARQSSFRVLHSVVDTADVSGELRTRGQARSVARNIGTHAERVAAVTHLAVAPAFERVQHRWFRSTRVRLFAPDPRVERAWLRSLFHIVAAMDSALPRIAAVAYPVFWIRGCTSILQALDEAARSDLARPGYMHLLDTVFAGPFGPEPDACGLAIHAFTHHAALTGDRAFASQAFPAVATRVRWIERMIQTTRAIKATSSERLSTSAFAPDANLLCYPAEHGMVRGRGVGQPPFYINACCIGGLLEAAEMARRLNKHRLANRWQEQADALELLAAERLLPNVCDDLDAMVAPHPMPLLATMRSALRDRLEALFRASQSAATSRELSQYPYVHAAQAHNAIRLGMQALAWPVVNALLQQAADNGPIDVGVLPEGQPGGPEALPFANAAAGNGWLNPQTADGANMPNCWAAAELMHLLRACFVYEEDERLILGAGVPEAWLTPGARFGVANLPTTLGRVSYSVTVADDGSLEVDYDGPEKRQFVLPRPLRMLPRSLRTAHGSPDNAENDAVDPPEPAAGPASEPDQPATSASADQAVETAGN